MKKVTALLSIILFSYTLAVGAQDGLTPSQIELEHRFRSLIAELRCLVCQNQSLADSHAELAEDMRREVHQLMERGLSDEETVQFLVDRYGDFVRYRPPVKPTTVLLWFGPFILLAIGVVVLLFSVRRHKASVVTPKQESTEREVRELLKKFDSDQSS